ncbi:hypothetical protein [Candidatus Uabimicrobium amorphum]|uniref:Uncharacterized protein n=1 Tax=Uabimicrobium amorphum TaxID=2596890 RepID=A0A5S9ILV1_UABAM|nr:hypothetical protein [Candidatus Uabimicrobium amorphum]BBM84259.1 hypothetical protein UABAM_02616 [Candidatus Uabimicrobium amorphum]
MTNEQLEPKDEEAKSADEETKSEEAKNNETKRTTKIPVKRNAQTKRTKRKKPKKSIWQRNWLACIAGLTIFSSLFLPWIGKTKGLALIWQMKNDRRLIEHLYHPQQDSWIFFGHLAIILAFVLVVFVEYWREKAGKFSALIYMFFAGVILATLGYAHIANIKAFASGMWVVIAGAIALGLSGSTMFYVKRR